MDSSLPGATVRLSWVESRAVPAAEDEECDVRITPKPGAEHGYILTGYNIIQIIKLGESRLRAGSFEAKGILNSRLCHLGDELSAARLHTFLSRREPRDVSLLT